MTEPTKIKTAQQIVENLRNDAKELAKFPGLGKDAAALATLRADELELALGLGKDDKAATIKQEPEQDIDQLLEVAVQAWNRHQQNCRITTVSGSLRKVVLALLGKEEDPQT